MPYVQTAKRVLLDPYIDEFLKEYQCRIDTLADIIRDLAERIEVNGDLNYVISKIIWTLFERNKRYATGDSLMNSLEELKLLVAVKNYSPDLLAVALYSLCKNCRVENKLGTIMNVEFEFYRRRLGIYEDLAINKNGDLEIGEQNG